MPEQVVIVGGGIAGTAAALALRTADIPVTVLESRPAEHGEGSVVRLNPNGMDALRAVDAHQPIIGASFPLVRTERVTPGGKRIGYALAADPASPRGLPRVLHWATLSRLLRERASERGATFRHDAAVVDVDERAAVLDTGERVEGDVLVGADGVHSLVRRRIDPDAPAPERIGTRTVYGFASKPGCEPPPPEVLRAQLGAKAFFAATRESRSGGCFWFTSLPVPERAEPRDRERLRAELVELYADDGGIAATVVANSESILTFDDHALHSLPHWQDRNRIVIGDALHVAPPASEQGAALAVEDGVELARCLRDLPVAEALATFERLRRERVEAVVAAGRAGTSRAHQPLLAKKMRELRSKAQRLIDWQRRPPTGGGWAYDHHIEWNEKASESG